MPERIRQMTIRGVDCTLWRGRNPEGRRVYAITADYLGVSQEPAQMTWYNIKAAREMFEAGLEAKAL